jgi:integrase/recombinase XerD
MESTLTIKWKAELIIHKGSNRIAIHFPNSAQLNQRIKKIADAKWSTTLSAWHIPDTPENRIRFQLSNPKVLIPETINNQSIQKLIPAPSTSNRFTTETIAKIEKYKQWLLSKRYSPNTIKTYSEALQTFLKYYAHKPINQIDNNDVIIFNNNFILHHKLSASYQNQIVNAIKLFFAKIENTQIKIDIIHRPKREKSLPNVLSKSEVKQILNVINNIKHKAMLSLIYSCGLRSSELINLKIHEVDSKRNLLIIKKAKGNKDRIAPLSDKTIQLLREYFKINKPITYLFEGQMKGEPYDTRSLQLVMKTAILKAKIKKPVTLHWLRHSYATHLLESGTDIRYIQEILGHKSSRTTEIYTHVSTRSLQKIISPFDDL